MSDDVRVYRASEIGGCVKSQVAAKLGYERLGAPAAMQEVFDAGTAAEKKIGNILAESGWLLKNPQLEVTVDVTPCVKLTGHIDWSGWKPATYGQGAKAGRRVIEAKSMSDAAYNDWLHMGWETPGLVQKYKWQLSTYMNALELPGVLVVYNRLTGDLDVTDVPEPFLTTGELKARVLEIDRFVRLGELPVDCSVRMYPCPFAYLEEQTYDPDNFEIEAVAIAYRQAATSEKVGKDAKGKLRKLLDEATSEASYKSERVTVTYFKRRNADRYDDRLIEAAGVDVASVKTSSGSSTQVRVTLHEPGDEG